MILYDQTCRSDGRSQPGRNVNSIKGTSNYCMCSQVKLRSRSKTPGLFAEEQKKSRQLALINNVSSHAITTLNPGEMLEKIAAEIENSLPYDHIGIAILDYSNKELLIQAEAGARKDAMGRRIPLGEGLGGPGRAHGPDGNGSQRERFDAANGSARPRFLPSRCP